MSAVDSTLDLYHATRREFLWHIGQIIACDKRCLYLTPSFGVNR